MIIELKLLLLLLAANGAPILTRKLLGSHLNFPLDGGLKSASGRRWLGPSKTLRGVFAGILATLLIAPLLGFSWKIGIIFGTLAMLGDLFSSFIKRRLGLPPSSQAKALDHIPESLFPLIYCTYGLSLTWQSLVFTVLAFWISGTVLSRLLFKIGIRRHPY
ncbi:MAG: CDP-archaeol synthase [Gammaproteobacteria bacterium]|nr:CDP-archaeol synthase [Gammaproteobacteria bacterium]